MVATTRADFLTGTKRKQEFFSDFLDNFDKSPIGDQLGRVTNEQAVNQSLKNLIKTNLGERLFQPLTGSDIYYSLFELNNNELNSTALEYRIENVIKNSEPRANLLSVTLIGTPDLNSQSIQTNFNENTIQINIVYNLVNNPQPILLTIFLKRIR